MTDKVLSKPITTVSKKFYAGMTADEAKKKNLYKSSTSSINFTDIDKNRNGILEDVEICEERDNECSRKRASGFLQIGGGGLVATVSAIADLPTAGMTTAGVIFGSGMTLAGFCAIKAAGEEEKVTNQYRKEHGLDVNM